MFLIDMNMPGVQVRPIVDMTGEEPEYNEVFLTDVRVPSDRLLGKEGDGWRIVIEQLQTERMGMTKPGAVWGFGPTARELMVGLMETGHIKDPLIRDEAAKLFVEGELLRLSDLSQSKQKDQRQASRARGEPRQDDGFSSRPTDLGSGQANPRASRNGPQPRRAAVTEGQLWSLLQLGLFLLVRSRRNAGRRHPGDPEKCGC